MEYSTAFGLCIISAAATWLASDIYRTKTVRGKAMEYETFRGMRRELRGLLGKNPASFPAVIKQISPTFCEIFSQAHEAEQDGSLYICGLGYGKALEFLIKDYAKLFHPDKGNEIEKCPLAKCIQNYVENESIKKSSDLARWLRNDETHYVKKYTSHDSSHLRHLITLTTKFIELENANNLMTSEIARIQEKLEQDQST